MINCEKSECFSKRNVGVYQTNQEDRNELLFNSVNENSDWISLRYLINIETGKNLPSIEMLIKLSIALEVDPVELFDDIYKILYNKE